eukprot:2540126-Alexandrium_andersonii.AAC.1
MLCSGSCMLAAMTSTWMLAWGIGRRGGAGVILASPLHVLLLALICPVAWAHSSCVSASDHMCH